MVNRDFMLSPARLGVILQREADAAAQAVRSTPGLPPVETSEALPPSPTPQDVEGSTGQPAASEEEGAPEDGMGGEEPPEVSPED